MSSIIRLIFNYHKESEDSKRLESIIEQTTDFWDIPGYLSNPSYQLKRLDEKDQARVSKFILIYFLGTGNPKSEILWMLKHYRNFGVWFSNPEYPIDPEYMKPFNAVRLAQLAYDILKTWPRKEIGEICFGYCKQEDGNVPAYNSLIEQGWQFITTLGIVYNGEMAQMLKDLNRVFIQLLELETCDDLLWVLKNSRTVRSTNSEKSMMFMAIGRASGLEA